MAAIGPDWTDTSVRWLRTNHPGYVPNHSRLSFPEQLDMALWRMNYLRFKRVDTEGWAKVDWRSSLKEVANTWTKEQHDDMVAYLTSGGFAVQKAVAEAERAEMSVKEAEDLTVADLKPFVINNPDGSVELVELEMPPAPLSSEAELAELMVEAARDADPRLGSW